jgi:DNA-directed RNA polymerase subunit beta'
LLLVKDGDQVERGTQLTEGSLDLKELFRLKGSLKPRNTSLRKSNTSILPKVSRLTTSTLRLSRRQIFSRHFVKDAGDTSCSRAKRLKMKFWRRLTATSRSRPRRTPLARYH